MSNKKFIFPSGLTSDRAKVLAKQAKKKLNKICNSHELDKIAQKECQLPWNKAVAKYSCQKEQTLKNKVSTILQQYPLLGYRGFYSPLGFDESYYQRRHHRTKKEYGKYFKEERIITDDWLDQIEKAQKFMALHKKNKNINKNMSGSYGLKHDCEIYYFKLYGRNCYISNGALIVAAILNGFNFEQPIEYHINCYFNISKRGEFNQWLNMLKYSYRHNQETKFQRLNKKYGPT